MSRLIITKIEDWFIKQFKDSTKVSKKKDSII